MIIRGICVSITSNLLWLQWESRDWAPAHTWLRPWCEIMTVINKLTNNINKLTCHPPWIMQSRTWLSWFKLCHFFFCKPHLWVLSFHYYLSLNTVPFVAWPVMQENGGGSWRVPLGQQDNQGQEKQASRKDRSQQESPFHRTDLFQWLQTTILLLWSAHHKLGIIHQIHQ